MFTKNSIIKYIYSQFHENGYRICIGSNGDDYINYIHIQLESDGENYFIDYRLISDIFCI